VFVDLPPEILIIANACMVSSTIFKVRIDGRRLRVHLIRGFETRLHERLRKRFASLCRWEQAP
jgi:hypothetical protein